jgi:hypothetical protein
VVEGFSNKAGGHETDQGARIKELHAKNGQFVVGHDLLSKAFGLSSTRASICMHAFETSSESKPPSGSGSRSTTRIVPAPVWTTSRPTRRRGLLSKQRDRFPGLLRPAGCSVLPGHYT